MEGELPMMQRIAAALAVMFVTISPVSAQQGGTFTPDSTPSQGTNSGGPVGTQALDRPTAAVPNTVGRDGQNCEKMANTVSGQRPAASGASDPQPQPKAKCEQK
jgi:hypothetical protein